MNIRNLLVCALGLCGFFIISLWITPEQLFENHQTTKQNKQLQKKIAPQNEAAGQVSPSLFGNEVEFETNNGVVYVYVNNRLAGPLQVQLSAGSSTRNMDASPSLPVTYLLQPKRRQLLTQLHAIDANAPMIRDLKSLRVPVDPHAIPDEVAY